ncbi:hypothetical protein D3C78_888820 [compost metagenome]
MRMSGFLVGGLVGAAAVMYFSKKRPGMMAWASHAITDMGSRSAGSRVASGMMNMKDSWKEQAKSATSKLTNQSTNNKQENWEQIEAIVNSDPEIKKEADKIKAETASVTH